MYMGIRYQPNRIKKSVYDTVMATIPNRIKWFDDMKFNMTPFDNPQDENGDAEIEIIDDGSGTEDGEEETETECDPG